MPYRLSRYGDYSFTRAMCEWAHNGMLLPHDASELGHATLLDGQGRVATAWLGGRLSTLDVLRPELNVARTSVLGASLAVQAEISLTLRRGLRQFFENDHRWDVVAIKTMAHPLMPSNPVYADFVSLTGFFEDDGWRREELIGAYVGDFDSETYFSSDRDVTMLSVNSILDLVSSGTDVNIESRILQYSSSFETWMALGLIHAFLDVQLRRYSWYVRGPRTTSDSDLDGFRPCSLISFETDHLLEKATSGFKDTRITINVEHPFIHWFRSNLQVLGASAPTVPQRFIDILASAGATDDQEKALRLVVWAQEIVERVPGTAPFRGRHRVPWL